MVTERSADRDALPTLTRVTGSLTGWSVTTRVAPSAVVSVPSIVPTAKRARSRATNRSMSNVPVNVPAPSESTNVPFTGIAETPLAVPRPSAAAAAPSMNVVSNAAINAGTRRRAFTGTSFGPGRRPFGPAQRRAEQTLGAGFGLAPQEPRPPDGSGFTTPEASAGR